MELIPLGKLNQIKIEAKPEESTALVKVDRQMERAPNLGRIVNQEGFLDFIAKVTAREQYEIAKQEITALEYIPDEARLNGNGEILLDKAAYAWAEATGVERIHVDKELEREISKEDMLKDLERFGAKPAKEVINQIYVKCVLNALREYSPREEYMCDSSPDVLFFNKKVSKEITIKPFFRKPYTISVKCNCKLLARLGMHFNTITVDLRDPEFLRACGDTLKQLEKRFTQIKHCRPDYHYQIY